MGRRWGDGGETDGGEGVVSNKERTDRPTKELPCILSSRERISARKYLTSAGRLSMAVWWVGVVVLVIVGGGGRWSGVIE